MSGTFEVETLPYDHAAAMHQFRNDFEAFRELVELFDSYHRDELEGLNSAIVSGESAVVREIAHRLKGATANFAATDACEAARELEEVGKANNLTTAPELYCDLVEKLDILQAALNTAADIR